MRAEALKGHLDGLLLAALEAGPKHGYAVRETLRELTDGTFDLPTGTIYPALHRLERAGLIAGDQRVVGHGSAPRTAETAAANVVHPPRSSRRARRPRAVRR